MPRVKPWPMVLESQLSVRAFFLNHLFRHAARSRPHLPRCEASISDCLAGCSALEKLVRGTRSRETGETPAGVEHISFLDAVLALLAGFGSANTSAGEWASLAQRYGRGKSKPARSGVAGACGTWAFDSRLKNRWATLPGTFPIPENTLWSTSLQAVSRHYGCLPGPVGSGIVVVLPTSAGDTPGGTPMAFIASARGMVNGASGCSGIVCTAVAFG
jgi:hypothetical protein